MMNNLVCAPWTPNQVLFLQSWQTLSRAPYRCPNCAPKTFTNMIPTRTGLLCPNPWCFHIQTFAWFPEEDVPPLRGLKELLSDPQAYREIAGPLYWTK